MAEKTLREILRDLAHDAGVRDQQLRGRLSPELLKLWSIHEDDPYPHVQSVVSTRIEQLIQALPEGNRDLRKVARVRYNLVAEIPDDVRGGLTSRAEWFADPARGRAAVRFRTQSEWQEKYILPDFERQIRVQQKAVEEASPMLVSSSSSPPPSPPIEPPAVAVPPIPSGGLRRRMQIGIPVGAVALATAVVVIVTNSGSAKPGSAINAAPQSTASSGHPNADGLNGLRVTALNFEGFAAAFPASQMEGAARFRDSGGSRSQSKAAFTENASAEGGYAVGGSAGGIVARIDLTGKGDEGVIIYNVRLVDLEEQPAVDGMLIIPPSQGGNNERIRFVLDGRAPVARDFQTGEPYFDKQHISLPHNGKTVLNIEIGVSKIAAYSFKVAIDYEIWGSTFTQVVDHNGEPFRVSAMPCPPNGSVAEVYAMPSLSSESYERTSNFLCQ